MTLTLHHRHPDPALWSIPARELATTLDGPTLIHIPGDRQPELFVSVLLHGDEVSGWDAVRGLLNDHGPTLPRGMALLIGNVAAAAHGLRHLPNEPDLNRVWKAGPTPEQQLAQQVLGVARERGVFASVDVHNNSGTNPHYSVLTNDDPATLGLARMFSPRAVFTRAPDTVSTLAFSTVGPALTIECGQPIDATSATRARGFLEAILKLDVLPSATPDELELYRSDVRVLIDDRISFDFGPGAGGGATSDSATLELRPELEAENFRALPAGTLIARLHATAERPLRATNGAMHDVTERYFAYQGNDIVLREAVIPAMYTTNPDIARQDCLCYFMERLTPLHSGV
jgi:hypothetical protein